MGFFSWKTADTNESISNIHSCFGALPCKMLMPNGESYEEYSYDGYGVFGGHDFYEEIALLNGFTSRSDGIDLYFSKNVILKPKIVSLAYDGTWTDVQDNEDCDLQGYFY